MTQRQSLGAGEPAVLVRKQDPKKQKPVRQPELPKKKEPVQKQPANDRPAKGQGVTKDERAQE
jgi:hypothetical protein